MSSHSRIVSQENEENVWKQGAGMWLYQPVPKTTCVFMRGGWIPREKFIHCAKAKAERKLKLNEPYRVIVRRLSALDI